MRSLRSLGALACAAGLLAMLPAAAGANVQVGSSGWQWGNPLPQGNTIRAMSFAGAQGYAAGDFGTLLSTADGGATWTGLPAGTFTGLYEVQAIDADSMFAGGGCVARRSDDAGRTFRRIAFTSVESICREGLAAGWFVNEQTGYLVLNDGTTLRTDNDGDTFAQKVALPGTRAQGGGAAPTDIVFTGPDTGVGATTDGRIYRTTDGANSWALVSDTSRPVRNFLFLDATTGYATGDGSLLLKTTDGGATWVAKALAGSSANLTSIRCATVQLCVMTTDRGDQLVRTADGGNTATLVTPSPDPVHAAAFASPTRIVAGGELGSTAVSDDAGRRSPRATTARWRARSTAAARGRAATSRPPRTSSTPPSRPQPSASRWTARAACSARPMAARRGRRSTPARPRGRARSSRPPGRSRSWPARPGCGGRPTAAARSTPCAARRSPGRASRRSTAPGARSSPRA
jgi:photosystem II stability/assembly factor-like uncharacterized protein